MDIGLLLLRLAVGLTLLAHGMQKLFGWFGGPGISATEQFFTVLGFPPSRRHALVAALGETVSGALLAVGLATPAAVAVVVSVMLVAIVTVHLGKGFFAQMAGTSTPSCLQWRRSHSHSLGQDRSRSMLLQGFCTVEPSGV